MAYIDREKVLQDIGVIPEGHISDYDAGRWDVRQKVIEQPTVDVVEVVRCKDCDWHQELTSSNKEHLLCTNLAGLCRKCKPTDFCPYGERRSV